MANNNHLKHEMSRKFEDRFSRFHAVHGGDGRTARHRAMAHAVLLRIASRGKNDFADKNSWKGKV